MLWKRRGLAKAGFGKGFGCGDVSRDELGEKSDLAIELFSS